MMTIFRFRYALHAILFALGFWAPWNYLVHLDAPGPRAHVWGTLAATLSRTFVLSIVQSFDLLLGFAILFAFGAAVLRTWAAAYLQTSIVKSGTMHAVSATSGAIVQDGPYRHLRNPLYAGTFLMALALSLLMPPSGAVFTIVAIGALQILLIFGEERFLSANLGQLYEAYCALVPRIGPRLRPAVQRTGLQPAWGQAFLGEFFFWGIVATYALGGWQYNADILIRGVLISLGIAIVLRALLPAPPKPVQETA